MRRLTTSALLLAYALVGPAPMVEAQHNQKSALVLHVVRRDGPEGVLAERVIRTTLTNGLRGQLDYYSEFIDAARFGDPEYEAALVDFLRRKYARRRFDLVVTSSNPAMTFGTQHRDELFPGVPIVFYASAHRPWPPLTTGVVVPFDLTGGLESAIQLHPDLRRVVVVGGASEYDRSFEEPARTQFRAFEDRLQFTYLLGLPLPELLRQVAVLPPDTVIYYLHVSEDGDGARFLPVDVLTQLAAHASRPIYGWVNVGLGAGFVGGRMLDLEAVMTATATLALRVLKGESPESLPVREIGGTSIAYDWRELHRWGISEARLPPGSVVRFRQPGIWDQYKSYIVGATLILALQTALIAGLVVQRARRRRIELALRRSERQFRAMAERNQDLAGRLISAQEVERTRIARDLHDDVSQQVAGVGIMLSGLKGKIGEPGLRSEVVHTLTVLQDRNSALANAVRSISHDLHPGVLQHAGLTTTLQRHCADIGQHHHVTVTFSAQDDFDSLNPSVALCLFRVAQEALTNTVRHARAHTIRVHLASQHGCVELGIVDDGVGFVPGERTRNGLGLRSIDERVRLVGGTVRLESRPGHGTDLLVRVPLAEAPVEAAVAKATAPELLDEPKTDPP